MVEETKDVEVKDSEYEPKDLLAEDSETSEESSTEETEGQEAEETTEEVDKTETEADDDGDTSDKPIPYNRFREVNEAKKKAEQEAENLRKALEDPDVLRVYLKKQGLTDEKIAETLKQQGLDEPVKNVPQNERFKELSQGLDLNTQEGWMELQWRMSKVAAEEAIKPVNQKLTKKESELWVKEQDTQARAIAKEVFDIEYGTHGKDENNPKTAIGKMMNYLAEHPEDAYLGHVKLLKLAMAGEGKTLGEQKGIQKEKERQKKLKSAAMEGETKQTKVGEPDESWRVEDIIAWREKHGE